MRVPRWSLCGATFYYSHCGNYTDEKSACRPSCRIVCHGLRFLGRFRLLFVVRLLFIPFGFMRPKTALLFFFLPGRYCSAVSQTNKNSVPIAMQKYTTWMDNNENYNGGKLFYLDRSWLFIYFYCVKFFTFVIETILEHFRKKGIKASVKINIYLNLYNANWEIIPLSHLAWTFYHQAYWLCATTEERIARAWKSAILE